MKRQGGCCQHRPEAATVPRSKDRKFVVRLEVQLVTLSEQLSVNSAVDSIWVKVK